MKKALLFLALVLILISGCDEQILTTDQSSINNSCTQDGECEAVFSSCSCSYMGCVKKTDEPREDCARFCSEEEKGPKPNCSCIDGECQEIKPCEQDSDCEFFEFKCCLPCWMDISSDDVIAMTTENYINWINKNCEQPRTCPACETTYENPEGYVAKCIDGKCKKILNK